MNKVIIIGIIVIAIGIGIVSIVQNYSDELNEISIGGNIEDKPKQVTVGLSESVGFAEDP